MPGFHFQQDALFHKTPFINLLLSSSRGKQKAQEEEVDDPSGCAEGKVRVTKPCLYLFCSVTNTLLQAYKNPLCQCLHVYCVCKQLYKSCFYNSFW